MSLFFSIQALSQKVIRHKVKAGESIYALAKKYDVAEKEIFALNPKLKGAILGLGDEVKIPNKKYRPETRKEKPAKGPVADSKEMLPSHLVLAKETLYSISKKYGIPIEAITDLNPEIKNGGLKAGMVLQLSGFDGTPPVQPEAASLQLAQPQQKNSESQPAAKSDSAQTDGVAVTHKVQPKESLYRISRQYNVSVADLQNLNPSVASGLPVGYELLIRKGTDKKEVKDSGSIAETASDVVSVSPLTVENLSKAEFLIAKASENLGARYRSGGTTPAGFDCSGLMFSTFKNIDMVLPRSSYDMAKYGVKIDKSQAQKGDLIFFSTFGRGRVSHVGMVTEVLDDEIRFIHSSTQSGVIISSTKEDYYARTFVQVNRVLAQ